MSATSAPDRVAPPFTRATRRARLLEILAERILVLDGAMGTMLQAHSFDEAAFRGERFRDHPSDLRGDSDLLCLTQPAAVSAVHTAYLDAGADVLSTNSFTATSIAQADYGFDAATVREMNVAAARLARDAADAAELAEPDRPRFVAGSLGPTNRTASMSSDVADPAARSVTWDELATAYREFGRRPRRGWRRHPPHRDDLRHAQREGRDLRRRIAVRRAGRAAAADHLGDHRRRVRPDAVGPDGRGVLAQHPPRRPADRRAELRARAQAAARAPRRPLARRRPAGLGLPERRPAERPGRLRRDARGDGRGAR